MSDSEICFMSAVDMARRLRRKELSALEVMTAHLAQIERVNPRVNALVTLVADNALRQARQADESLARGDACGPLHGLPVAHKDLVDTRGMRTTYGSPIYRDHVPKRDALVVERLKKAGAITVGKSNTPEFGAGSQTFNAVFGATLNPYDTSKTCGGSSGGAAVALACGMVPIADGSDMGGSLRNPAAFCNVVGLRPSPGRVPNWPCETGWFTFSVEGPMARRVQDAALMLSVLAGPDTRSPIALGEPGVRFAAPLDRSFKDVKMAWGLDMGGLPLDPGIRSVVAAQREVFNDLGCRITPAFPDLGDADEVFKCWRAWSFELGWGWDMQTHRDQMKDTVIWNIEAGLELTGPQLGRAEVKRTQLYHRLREFMQDYEFIVMPVTQVPPFDVSQPYVTEIDGIPMETYIDWMKSCYYISVTGHPALSVPCGFTPEGLPVGIQIVGRHQDDWGVLQLGHAFEKATGYWRQPPPLALP